VAVQLGLDGVELALTGGEDYELCVCIAPDRRAEAEAAVGSVGLTWVGEVRAGAAGASFGEVKDARGGRLRGFEHRP
jgi:thiamine-monophosphate kinase